MTTIIEKVLQLQDVDCFRFAYTEHLAQLASVCDQEDREDGSTLFSEGEPCKTFYLLTEGQVNLESTSGETRTVQKCALDPWSFFAQEPHQYTGTSLESCVLYTVSYEEMTDLLTAEPEFCWAITRYLAKLGRTANLVS